MSKHSHSNQVSQQGKDGEQPKNVTAMDTMTMGDLSLERAERYKTNGKRFELNG